ncbi:MAG: D-glycero-beta-D-manno-heptose-7-phosphate kinase [Acidobacteriota bacterium]|nr:D-glycero-beta-D-manno-heptose-7-phosphate kinase [Acidobacteriota bacterium]
MSDKKKKGSVPSLIAHHSSLIKTLSDKETIGGERLAALVRSFAGRRVLVLGDLIADQFVSGEISRVSREAPVMILRHERTETIPGGAANCALNLSTLGARAALVGVVGEDSAGGALLEKLSAAGVDCRGIVVRPHLRTTTKVRILAGHAHSPRQQVVRLDYESDVLTDNEVLREIAGHIREAYSGAEAVIISDYNYGVACAATTDALRAAAVDNAASEGSTAPVLVDSRFRLAEFAGFASATPNEDEVEQVSGRRFKDDAELASEGEALRAKLGYKSLLVTRGKHGMLLLEEDEAPLSLDAVGSHDAVDVTGAGDTVIATYALALASGAGFREAARLANHAGGVVVLKRGTACVNPQELLASLEQAEGHEV